MLSKTATDDCRLTVSDPSSSTPAMPWDRTMVTETVVGSESVTFADGNNATFAYTMSGNPQSKPITRQVLVAPGTICQ